MREILFRGKRVDNGEWVEGFFWKDIWGDGESCYIHYDTEDYQVDPTTVGQYTGLNERSGKRIFDGDIVYDNFYFRENHIKLFLLFQYLGSMLCTIELQDEHLKIKNKDYWIPKPMCFESLMGFEPKICGNIHDNPELLEVK